MNKQIGPVFISYAHEGKGAKYLDWCKQAVEIAALKADAWSDDRIQSGDSWQREIETALAQASAAILLIDWSFLLSHYVTSKEIPAFFVAQAGLAASVGGAEQASRIPVIPILVESCEYEDRLPWLNRLQMEPETSIRKVVDPKREQFKGLLTLERVESYDGEFKTALAKRLKIPPRTVQPQAPVGARVAGNCDVQTSAQPPQNHRDRFARYLKRGEDISGNRVSLQINFSHAEFSTFKLETRLVIRDGTDGRSEYRYGLATLKVPSELTDPCAPGLSYPLCTVLSARVSASPAPDGQLATVGDCIAQAQAKAQDLALPLQLQIGINENAGELHEIPWEFLQLDDGTWIAHSNDILFSRSTLSAGSDAIECHTHTRDTSHVLTVYCDAGVDLTTGANPSHHQSIHARMMEDLSPMLEDLSPMSPHSATRQSLLRPDSDVLFNQLSVVSSFDILYLACEGGRSGNEFVLHFPDRALTRAELAEHFRRAPIPRFVILVAAHQLAGDSANPESILALSHFAAMFSRLGAANVLTCQRAMPAERWSTFLSGCLGFLAEHGHMPGAVAAARQSTLDDTDWWHPVLVSRPKSAHMWYQPSFVSDDNTAANWESLLTSLRSGRFCPVIGPGIHHQLQAARIQLAREMADEFDFPLNFSSRINLPSVAQYVRTLEPNTGVFSAKLEQRIRRHLRGIAGVDDEIDDGATLYDLAFRVGTEMLKLDASNPYNLLAKLPVSLYVTTNLDPFLEAALALARTEAFGPVRRPLDDIHAFDFTRVDPDKSDAVGETALPFQEFSPASPLILQLYGSYRRLGDAVIAEDDYFQFLATFAKRIQDVRGPLEGKLGESDLIFLGFKWNSLHFRVLFRALQKYARIKPAMAYHIAVQVDPDDDETTRPDKVLEYLKRYFAGGKQLQQARLSLFWGATEDFLKELSSRI